MPQRCGHSQRFHTEQDRDHSWQEWPHNTEALEADKIVYLARRKGSEVVAAMLAFVLLFAVPTMAQFRIADQIYLPSAIHIGQWQTDAWITNETSDPVDVTADFWPANAPPVRMRSAVVLHLAPRENRDIADLLGTLGLSGMGQLTFNGCRGGADCRDGAPNAEASYRNISVESRTYLRTATGGTLGQDVPGLAWWAYGDRNYPLKIVGIRVGPQYRTNIGLVSVSEHAGIWLLVTLHDGPSNAVRDQVRVHLNPMESLWPKAVATLFPLLGNWSRLNRGRSTSSAYVTVSLDGVEPAVASGVPADCLDSCAAFLAYGSLIDNLSSAATTLEATFSEPTGALSVAQVASVFSASGSASVQALRASAKGIIAPEPRCSIVGPDRRDGSYLVLKAASWQEGVPWDRKVKLPWLHITPNELTVTRAFCSGALEGGAQ